MGELKIPRKEDESESLINKSKAREYIISQGLKISSDISDNDFLNEIFTELLDRVIAQAKKNGKDEVSESDLKIIKEKELLKEPIFEKKIEDMKNTLMKHITDEHEKTRMSLTLETRKVIDEMVKNRKVDRIIDILFTENIPPKKVMKHLLERIKEKKFDDKEAIEYITLLEKAVKEYKAIKYVFEKTRKEKILSGITKMLDILITSGVKGLVSEGIKEVIRYLS